MRLGLSCVKGVRYVCDVKLFRVRNGIVEDTAWLGGNGTRDAVQTYARQAGLEEAGDDTLFETYRVTNEQAFEFITRYEDSFYGGAPEIEELLAFLDKAKPDAQLSLVIC